MQDLKDIKLEKFWEDDVVTISKIGRAKCNNAYIVYIVGIEEIEKSIRCKRSFKFRYSKPKNEDNDIEIED